MPETNKETILADLMLMKAEVSKGPVYDLPEQYEILGRVSQGGMGWIYKAQNRHTGVLLAIKILRPEYARDKTAMQRFVAEAKAASGLKHPNICQVYDFGLTDSQTAYLVMDWINGVSLGAKVKRDLRVPPIEAIVIFQQVASALAHAHQNKVVHRDLKPDNIMLSRDADGRTVVSLVDFGIAKVLDEESGLDARNLTQTGVVVGTPTYMSPEQARGEQIDGRTDIYSFGCMMFFALAGKPPFLGATVVDTITKHLTEPVPELDPALKIPSDLKMILLSCMEKNRADRYQTMLELGSDLKKISKGVTLEHRILSSHRAARNKRQLTILYFVLGFSLMYCLSLGLQGLLDRGAKPEGSAPTPASASPAAPPSTAPEEGKRLGHKKFRH
jgi:serine/threonine protein kinase